MILPYDETKKLFSDSGIELERDKYDKLALYAELLVEWNGKINLTAITDPYGITVKHFLDSALMLKYAAISDNASIIDVGTGAGFPGIPLKIMKPDIKLTLLDSLNKRVNFLNAVADKLEINAETIHSRAEDGGRNSILREKFDISCARAVAALPVLCEYCLPYVKVGGKFCAMKGPNENYKDAFTAYHTLGAEISDAVSYELPDGDKRQLIIFNKVRATPIKYPRNSGQISKKNL